MKINFAFILNDIKTNDKFLEAAPQFKDQILEFRAKPNCGGCRQIVRQIMQTDIPFQVYGKDIELDRTLPMPPKMVPKLHKIPLEEFEKYLAEKASGLPSFTYVPGYNQMWVVVMEAKDAN